METAIGNIMQLPLSRVTIMAHSQAAYEWINASSFSTGLLVSNIQEKLVLEQGKNFPQPNKLDLFQSCPTFVPELFQDLLILECDPVRKGLLSLHTEIIIVQQLKRDGIDANDTPEIKAQHREHDIRMENVFFISEFASPLSKKYDNTNTGRMLDLVADVSNKARKVSTIHVTVIHDYSTYQSHLTDIRDAQCDIFNCILVTKEHAKRLGLFDADFIECWTVGKSKNLVKFNTNAIVCRIKVVASCRFESSGTQLTGLVLPTVAFSLQYCDSPAFLVVFQRYARSRAHGGAGSERGSSGRGSAAPACASEVRVACVHSPTYSSQCSHASTLRHYFSTPRVVKKHGIIACPTLDDVEYWQVGADNGDVRKPVLYFKVLQVESSVKGEHSFLAHCAHTTLVLEPPTHSYIPSVMHLATSASNPVIPPGLETYHQTIVDWFKPYTRSKCLAEGGGCAAVLVAGGNGCGKSRLAHAVAATLQLHCMELNCHELCGETAAATESRVKQAWQRAASVAPCLLSLRHLHALATDRHGTAQDVRVAGSLRQLLSSAPPASYPVLVLASTCSLQGVSADLQQAFLYTLSVQAPGEACRQAVLRALLPPLHHSVSTRHLAQRTAGMNLGDIRCLLACVRRKALARIVQYWKDTSGRSHMTYDEERIIAESGVLLKAEDFEGALKDLQKAHSSSIGAPQIPNVRWEDVGGLKSVKRDILDTIQLPLEHPELFAAGLKRSGVLFYGPPGTGKTLLAKAVATECSLNFLSVKGPELINMYVGQSEENVREVFEKARSASPCVIFFDELDSLAPNRGRSGDSGGVMDRVVSQLLAELDGIGAATDVFVIGATNRPDLLDPALLRPGRFDKLLYLGVSEDKESQLHILKALTRKFRLSADCELAEVVQRCPPNMTGADFYALCSDAMLIALKTKVTLLQQGEDAEQGCVEVCRADFERALQQLVPSVSLHELQRYTLLQQQLQHNTSH